MLDRNLESQKEKLESDLKREIKKLQKNRELIKNWQLSDTVEVVVTPSKLQEYRKLVEEAMEKYKEVEKSSKMKSFSNQSIMLASLEESQNLSKEAIEVISFLEDSIEQITGQLENLELEYDKLSGRKNKKNSSIESERQELENFINMDKFHLERFESIIDYVKQKQIDPNLVLKIKDDITFYLESNQEPDFIDDETLYDEIIQQATSNYKYTPDDDKPILEETIESQQGNVPPSTTSQTTPSNVQANNTSTSLSKNSSNNSSTPAAEKAKSKSPSPNTPTKKPLDVATPVKTKAGTPTPDLTSPEIVQKLKPATTPSKVSGEVAWSSVAGVAAAVSGAPSSSESDKATLATSESKNITSSTTLLNGLSQGKNGVEQQNDPIGSTTLAGITNSSSGTPNASTPPTSASIMTETITPDHPYYNYTQVLSNSGLMDSELKLFTNMDLIRIPPGIQNFIMSFTSSRKIRKDIDNNNSQKTGKLLFNSSSPNSLSTPIRKPYLPKEIQNSFYQYNSEPGGNGSQNSEKNGRLKNDEISNGATSNKTYEKISFIKPPLHLMNFQNYWNKIRCENSFDAFVSNIKGLIERQQQQQQLNDLEVINELVQVLFYGFFYGITPMENLIAETKLFELGWRPYGIKFGNQKLTNGTTAHGTVNGDVTSGLNPDKYYYWFRSLNPNQDSQEPIEFGDYQVFDLNTWEIHLKLGFRFDKSLSVQSPLSVIT